MMQDMDQYWTKDICNLCFLQFCVCALTKLELKMKILENIPDPIIDRKPAEDEDTADQDTDNIEKLLTPQSPDHQPCTVGGDQDTKGAQSYPQHPDHHPGIVGGEQGEVGSGQEDKNQLLLLQTIRVSGQQLDHKHEHVGEHVAAEEPGRALGHDTGAIRKLPGKRKLADYFDMNTPEQKPTRPDNPNTEDVLESRRQTPKTPRSTTTPKGKISGTKMKKKKEDRKLKTTLMNWMQKTTLEKKEEAELDRKIHRDRKPNDLKMNIDRHFGITLKKVVLPTKVTIPTDASLTGTRPKCRQSVSDMINCYNNLNSYNTGSSGANRGGQVDGHERGGHDLPGRNHERLRDVGRSEVTAPQLLRDLTGPVATNKPNSISAVDSVLTNEEMRFSKAVRGIVRPQDSVSIVDSPEEKS